MEKYGVICCLFRRIRHYYGLCIRFFGASSLGRTWIFQHFLDSLLYRKTGIQHPFPVTRCFHLSLPG